MRFRHYLSYVFVPLGFVVGYYLDNYPVSKMTTMRNKSALYGRELKPDEEATLK